jgi:hypothetical protein
MQRSFSRILLLTLFLFLFAACAGKGPATQTGQQQPLKQKVLFAPFHNPWQEHGVVLDERFDATMRDWLAQNLGSLFFVDSFALQEAVASSHGALAGLGGLDALMEKARNEGVNAIVTGRLAHIGVQREKRGVYGLRQTVPVMRVAMNIWVYDALTGSKILDENLESRIILSHEPALGTLPPVAWTQEWEQMALTAGRMACNALRRLEWRSFVTDADKDMITLAAGADAGLVSGTVLSVYRPVVRSKGPLGQRFIFSGDKIGTVRVVEVGPDRSKAARLNGEPFQPGDWVRP